MPIAQLSERAVVRISGPHARAFLQGQLTNDIDNLTEGAPLYGGLLSPQGKAQFALMLFAQDGDILVDCAASQVDTLVRRLLMFRLRKQFDVVLAPDLQVFAAWGDERRGRPDPRLPDQLDRFVATAGTEKPTASTDHWHSFRLPLGLPEADEIGDAELMWLETNGRELNGTSFTKGCYTGQENVARMHHRDKLRKRLLPVRLDGITSEAQTLTAEGREAGALRGERHGDMQMALLKIDALGRTLTAGGTAVTPVIPPWLPADEANTNRRA